jgi:tetratricopeptide (TPR) repeat protein
VQKIRELESTYPIFLRSHFVQPSILRIGTKLTKSKEYNELADNTEKSFKNKEYDWAIVFGESWIKLRPGDEKAYYQLGKALLENNSIERAKEIGKHLIRIKNLSPDGYEILGKAFMVSGESLEAIPYLEKVVALESQSLRQYRLHELSEAYENTGNIDKAIAALTEAISYEDDVTNKHFMQQRLNDLQLTKRRLESLQD